ncbi:hypothetical protein NP493_1535g00000 [Ridgeia piscesae]|uniref:Uncharacterized protein n=1 Tax=Ridgeia piscesae TaxID=27915 RepID=A0AAD9JZ43_RIDPI|nr:hypothetical protein NP493_1535g00000 [Ridgeia piscesae]
MSRTLTAKYTWDRDTAQHQRQIPRRGDSQKNHGRMDNIRHAPRQLQGNIGTCLKRQVYN